MSQIRHS